MFNFGETKFTAHPSVTSENGVILVSEQMSAKDGSFVTALMNCYFWPLTGKYDVSFFYCVRPTLYATDSQYSAPMTTFAALMSAVNARLNRELEVADGEAEATPAQE